MLSAEENCLNLSDLPSDIIQNIVKIGLLFVDNMCLISPRWNANARDVLSDRRNLPVIKCIRWDLDTFANPFLRMTLSAKHCQYFGVYDWKTTTIFADNSVEVLLNYGEYIIYTHYDKSRPTRLNEKALLNIQKIINRCSSIGRVEFAKVGFGRTKDHWDAIERTMTGAQVNELYIESYRIFDRELTTCILNLIATISPRHLILTDSNAQLAYTESPVLVDFYWKLTQIVPEIECIFACSDCYINKNRIHCEELSFKIADTCKIVTELLPYSHHTTTDSDSIMSTANRIQATSIIMRKL